ncbi:MAG: hypothetical protein SNH66_07115 [Rikenellaceae bacterium]
MSTIMDKQQKWLLRQFHTLCTRLGLTEEEKRSIILGCGVESSKDIDNHDLMNICHTLETQLKGKGDDNDKLRKRVIAAVGGWLKLEGRESNMEIIKGIACRATGYDNFNKIPTERLRNVYNTFLKKQKDTKAINEIADSYILNIITAPAGSATKALN